MNMTINSKGEHYVSFSIGEFSEWEIEFRDDGCVHLWRYWNGTRTTAEDDYAYMHICELEPFIEMLKKAKEEAEKHLTADRATSTVEPRPLTIDAKSEINLTQEFDARVWAKEWLAIIAVNPSIPTDEGCMISWFANALMAGYDHARREASLSSSAMDTEEYDATKGCQG